MHLNVRGVIPTRVWQLAAVLFLAAPAARAQALGAITGTITDPSGAAVPRAKVTATESETSFARAITSDDTGHFTLPSLRPTEYTLTVEATGSSEGSVKCPVSSDV